MLIFLCPHMHFSWLKYYINSDAFLIKILPNAFCERTLKYSFCLVIQCSKRF